MPAEFVRNQRQVNHATAADGAAAVFLTDEKRSPANLGAALPKG
jgi:hypothetical protein